MTHGTDARSKLNHVDRPIIQSLGIFAGSGFHDTGVELALDALGIRLRAVGYVERDSAAAATLLARMECQTLSLAPVWCDCISNLDARPLRGHVDLIIASPPCQPYSSAGKRLGNSDDRSHGDGDGPLPNLVRVIDECQPALVWFENVPEWFTGGHFRSFGDELCRLGFDFTQPVFASSRALGNVHERERGFILGYTHGVGERVARWLQSKDQRRERSDDSRRDVGDAGCQRDQLRRISRELRTPTIDDEGEASEWERSGDATCDAGQHVGHTKRQRPGIAGDPQPEELGGRRGVGPVPRRDELADCNSGRFGTDAIESGSEGPRVHGHTERGGAKLAESESRGRGAGGESPGCDGLAVRGGGQLGQPVGTRREGRERCGASGQPGAWASGPTGESGSASVRRFDRPLCPPGRSDYRRWAELVALGLDPTNMPPIERGVSVVADALAPSASDLLRIGGNGVDPIVVAYAFLRSWSSIT